MKKILVTGASGFIGRNTLEPLIKGGYEVHAVYLKNKLNVDNVIWHQINLLDYNQTEQLLKIVKPSHLLHLAWNVAPGKYLYSKSNYEWLIASIKLLNSFKENGGQRVVIAGTIFESEYDYPYPASKRALLEILKSIDISYAWGRIPYLFGEYEDSNRLVPYVINALLNGDEAKCSSGEQIKDFMYVKDVAGAFVKIINSDIYGVINIGSGEGIKVKDLILKIADKLNSHELIKLGTLKTSENEKKYSVANISRLKNEVEFSPEFTIDEGLERVIEWSKIMFKKGEKY